MKRREPIRIDRALWLHKQLGSWAKVQRYLRRSDGSLFTYAGISAAIQRSRRAA